MKPMRRNILVTLDSLLDTRLTTLEQYLTDREIADLLISGEYHNRLEDKFGNVSKETFKKGYEARTERVLINALLTNIVFFIQEYLLIIARERVNEPFRAPPSIFVNFHPYKLGISAEKAFCEVLMSKLTLTNDHEQFDFRFGMDNLNLSNEELTPNYLVDRQVSCFITYEGLDWLNAQATNLETQSRTAMKEMELITPALYLDGSPESDDVKKLREEEINPLDEVQTLARMLVNFRYIDVKSFSVVGYEPGLSKKETEDT